MSAPGAGLTICCGSWVSNQLGWSGFMDSLSLCGGGDTVEVGALGDGIMTQVLAGTSETRAVWVGWGGRGGSVNDSEQE